MGLENREQRLKKFEKAPIKTPQQQTEALQKARPADQRGSFRRRDQHCVHDPCSRYSRRRRRSVADGG